MGGQKAVHVRNLKPKTTIPTQVEIAPARAATGSNVRTRRKQTSGRLSESSSLT
jgi:hypothetical protein